MTEPSDLTADTLAVHAGRGDPAAGAPLNVPPHLASVFRFGGDSPYTRYGNPNFTALEAAVGALEHGHALAFASGMAAISAVFEEVPVGGKVVAPYDAYLGTRALLERMDGRGRIQLVLADVTDTDATLAAADGADLLWLESPTNPLLGIADLRALIGRLRPHGIGIAVDNTFATPLLQRPLDLGADVVVHSGTKYLAGHSDVMSGVVVVREEALRDALDEHRRLAGAAPSPMDTWLTLRGLRTLPVRLERAQASAQFLAARLAEHPDVQTVRYPGLATGPQAERVAAQMDGPGAMLSFEMPDAASADTVCASARVIAHATSLGSVESTMERRRAQPGEEHVAEGLIRLSVGCEHAQDLWRDLDQAIGAAS